MEVWAAGCEAPKAPAKLNAALEAAGAGAAPKPPPKPNALVEAGAAAAGVPNSDG